MRLEHFHQEMMQAKRAQPPFILVGNKLDGRNEREVSITEGVQLAAQWGCPYFETSAKTRHNVEEAFTHIVRMLRQSDSPRTHQDMIQVNHSITYSRLVSLFSCFRC